MTKHSQLTEFITALAEVRNIFRDIHICMERKESFSKVSTDVIPFSGRASQANSKKTSINITTSGELLNWKDINKKAFGVSLLICYADEKWTLECEYGWSGQEVGWDPIEEIIFEYETADELVSNFRLMAIGFKSSVLDYLSKNFL
jgi:hypothetical protein